MYVVFLPGSLSATRKPVKNTVRKNESGRPSREEPTLVVAILRIAKCSVARIGALGGIGLRRMKQH